MSISYETYRKISDAANSLREDCLAVERKGLRDGPMRDLLRALVAAEIAASNALRDSALHRTQTADQSAAQEKTNG